MERFYRIADINFRISGQNQWMYRNDGVLAPFRTESVEPDQSIVLEVADQLSEPEGLCVFTGNDKKVFYENRKQVRYEGVSHNNWDHAYMRIWRKDERSFGQVKRSAIMDQISSKLALTAMELEHQLVQRHGFLFHSSYIRCGDAAILFTAPSGTGKSTQADLWCRLRGAELINGDRSAVVVKDGRVAVYGIPYSGSSGVSKNETLPLRVIVRLTQAPVTKIERLTGLNAFRHVWEGCCVNTWNRDDMSRCMQTVMDVVKQVPVFHLACTPDESAVIALEEALKKLR